MLSQKESAIPGDMALDSLPEIIKQTPTELDNSSLESGFTPLEPVSSYLYFSSINIVNRILGLLLFQMQITSLLHLNDLLFESKEQALTLC